MFRKLFLAFLILFFWINYANALEVQRDKNVATYITFPLIASSDDVSFKSSATALDSEIDAWADGSAPDGFIDCTNEATEIGTTGIYYLLLTQSEMNQDYIIIQVKATDANTQAILINTKPKETMDTIATYVDTEVAAILADTGTDGVVLANDAITAAKIAASAIGSSEAPNLDAAISSRSSHGAADVWSVATRVLTAGTNISLAKGTGVTGFNDIAATDVWAAATRTLTSGGYSGLTATDIDTIWDELTTGHITVSSFGKLFVDNLNATVGSRSSHSAADVWSVATRQLTGTQAFNLTGNITGNVSGSVGSVTGAVGSVTGAVGSVTGAVGSVTGAVTVGTNNDKTGYRLSTTGIDDIWDEVITGHSTIDSFGKVFDDQIDGLRSYGDSNWKEGTAIY